MAFAFIGLANRRCGLLPAHARSHAPARRHLPYASAVQ